MRLVVRAAQVCENLRIVHAVLMVELRPASTTVGRTALGTVACLAVAFGTWMAWFAWDTLRDVNPGTAETTGPYELWQGLGAAATLLILVVVALRWLAAVSVVPAVSLGFTAGFTVSGATDPQTDGLYIIGAGLLLVAMLLATAVVALLVRLLVRKAR